MPHIELRRQFGVRSPQDLQLSVREETYKYLMSFPSPEIRISTYLDRDLPQVEANYAEVFVHETCRYRFKVNSLIPGSKTRSNITLPCAMKEGEQLTILVNRENLTDPGTT